MAKQLRDGEIIRRITKAIRAFGPMTLAELSVETKVSIRMVDSSFRAMQKPNKVRGRIAFIRGWVRGTHHGMRDYCRPVVDLGDERDAPRPPPLTGTQRAQRMREKTRTKLEALHFNSIFNLGRGPTFQGATMKLYQTTVLHSGLKFQEFSSSSDAASKVRTRLKKNGMPGPTTEEVDVPTTRNELVVFLNKRLAHPSHIPPAVAERLTETAGS